MSFGGSRNVFVHESTCQRVCELPTIGRRRVVGVIQASFTSNAQNTHAEDATIETTNRWRISAPVQRILSGNKFFVSEKTFAPFFKVDCLERFDESLRRSCHVNGDSNAWLPRYYFDRRLQSCRMYWNDGCRSNSSRNDFSDLNTCRFKCEGQFYRRVDDASFVRNSPDTRSCLDSFDEAWRDDCQQGRFHHRYFFNAARKRCELFRYGGCASQTNSTNLFDYYEECLELCETPTRAMSSEFFGI